MICCRIKTQLAVQLAFNTDFVYSKSNAITGFEALSYQQDNQKNHDLQF
jgi:hypothetical protein